MREGHAGVQINAPSAAVFGYTCHRLQFVQPWSTFGIGRKLSTFPVACFFDLGKGSGYVAEAL